MKHLAVFSAALVILANSLIVSAMTDAQLKAAGRLIRNMCQPKVKITDEQIQEVQNGNFESNKKLMCYIDCIYTTFKVMKNGELLYDAALAQVEQMPDSKREVVRGAFSNCKDKAVGEQKCESAYNFAKCLYEFDPIANLIP